MNLGNQSPRFDNSDQTHAALPGSPDRSQRAERSKTRSGFNANDHVVYPAHGVGQILAIEKQTVAGASLEFFVIYFVKNKMTLRVPTQKAANLGMRELSDSTAIEHVRRTLSQAPYKARGTWSRLAQEYVRRTLSQAPYKARGTWSRLAQEYESKINSGDIIAIAEAMRDLYRPQPSQSYSEQQLYAVALDRLVREIAVVQQITEKEVIAELEGILIAGRTQKRAQS
jgi:CarD family transcriptional regulator